MTVTDPGATNARHNILRIFPAITLATLYAVKLHCRAHVSGCGYAAVISSLAVDIAKKQGDEYVTLEALLMAIFAVNSPASAILKDAGLTDKELEGAVAELRKGKKATDQSAEDTYQAILTNVPAKANLIP